MDHKIDEENFLKKIQEGDSRAYRFLFENYFDKLCLYAVSLTKCADSAKDIVQNVFLTLWIKRESISIETCIKNYLYKSVYNNFLNEYKVQKRKGSLLSQLYDEALNELITDEAHDIQEKLIALNENIDRLPSKSKKIFIMNKREGLTYREISKLMNISENTVESHIGRALKRLRLHLVPSSNLEEI